MITANSLEEFIITVNLINEEGAIDIGKDVFYDIRNSDDTALTTPVDGVLLESTVEQGIYKKSFALEKGCYVCYITCSDYPPYGEEILIQDTTIQNISDDVWSHQDAVSLITDVEFIKQIESGKWTIEGNQMVFYDDTNTTELIRFNLFDRNNSPASEGVYKRERT